MGISIRCNLLRIFQFRATGELSFDITTNDPSMLPVTDFELKDYGGPKQKFGFTIGPVCFIG